MSGSTTRLYMRATLRKNSIWIGYLRLGRFSALASAQTERCAHKQDDDQPNFFSTHTNQSRKNQNP
jgi:hypothetical protein